MKDFYIHTSLHSIHRSKKTGEACGDVSDSYRDRQSTTIVLCDGIGSGLKANIYASMCCSRLINLIKGGVSAKEAFYYVGETMNKAWGSDKPFSVFTIMQIRNSGKVSIFSYDMPRPVLISEGYANEVDTRERYWEKALIGESSFFINKNDAILLLSDGITQAGIGNGMAEGWGSRGVSKFLNQIIKKPRYNPETIINRVSKQADSYWGKYGGDDTSVILALNRKGITINIMTGPPANPDHDHEFVQSFIQSEGIKVVCGGSTSKMLARELNIDIDVCDECSAITPPSYSIEGIDLATEGIVTLNQVYNVLFENVNLEASPVSELCDYLQLADKIIFWIGNSHGVTDSKYLLKQQGISNRKRIVELISEKLREHNRLVLVEEK